MKPGYQAAVIFALLVIWMGLGIFKEPEADTKLRAVSAPALESVSTALVLAEDFRRPVRVRASTEAERYVTVTARTTGVVTRIPWTRGSQVSEGDLLCQLAEEDKRAALAEAESEHKAAEVEWQATRQLVRQQLSSELDATRKQTALQKTIAELERARLQLEYTQIRAPFDGVLDDIPVEEGGTLVTGQPCAQLLDLDTVRVRGYIAEAEVDYVAVGDPVEVKLSSGLLVTGELSFVSKRADEASRTFQVEARLSNPDLKIRHGLSADLLVYAAAQQAHHIPASALLLDTEDGVIVRILDDESAVRQVPVEILYDDIEGIWVSGLPKQARLITVGHFYVRHGQVVRGVETSLQIGGGAFSSSPDVSEQDREEAP